jgi:hypothetical protein
MRQSAWLLTAFILCAGRLTGQTASNPPPTQAPSVLPGTQTTALLRPEHLVTFDYQQAELRWIDQRWQLVAGEVWLKDFGRREADARAALRTIQSLRLTQRGTIGMPMPVIEYWLADGQAPQGFVGAGRLETLDASSLRVEQVEGQWCLRDNRHRLFAFGPHREEADQALAVIRHYGFTHMGIIGPATPTMIFFLANDHGLGRNHYVSPAELKAGALAGRKLGEKDPQPRSPAAATDLHGVAQESSQPSAPSRSGGHAGANTSPAAKNSPQRLAFDYRQVQLRHDDKDWKLVFGGYVFANFGDDHYAAQQALSLFQYYRFTEEILIGRPTPTFSYFLVAGQPPRGLKFGLPAESFFPESVTVRQLGKQWIVCENERPLVNFGDCEEDARELARAIQRHRFDHLCRLGNGPGRSLTILVRAR